MCTGCPHARGTTAEGDVRLRSRGTNASELLEANRPRNQKRAQGRPGAHRTHGPRATKSTRQNHRYRRIIRPSLRNGFNGFLRALPGDHCLVATVARETRERLHDLSACVGAPEPHDFAVRCSIIRPRKKLRLTLPRPSHPIPNVRDDREPPLYGERDERKKATDLGVRSIAAHRDRLARRANYADEACTFASQHRSSFRGSPT